MNKLKTKLFKKKKETEDPAFQREYASSQQAFGTVGEPQLLDIDELQQLDGLATMQSSSSIFADSSAVGFGDDNLDGLAAAAKSTLDASSSTVEPKNNKGDDRYKSIYATAMTYGYILKKYKYTTDDGYINTVFRLMKNTVATDAE